MRLGFKVAKRETGENTPKKTKKKDGQMSEKASGEEKVGVEGEKN